MAAPVCVSIRRRGRNGDDSGDNLGNNGFVRDKSVNQPKKVMPSQLANIRGGGGAAKTGLAHKRGIESWEVGSLTVTLCVCAAAMNRMKPGAGTSRSSFSFTLEQKKLRSCCSRTSLHECGGDFLASNGWKIRNVSETCTAPFVRGLG